MDDIERQLSAPPARRRLGASIPGWVRGVAFSVTFTLVLLEIAARGFWAYWLGMSPLHSSQLVEYMHYAYYPNLQSVAQDPPQEDNGAFDVLMLGGSVINGWYGDIETGLHDRLQDLLPQPVNVFNVSFPAHTTRDSYEKYRRLANAHFDLVLVYHGVNDVPANNVPAEWYREDYSHYLWNRGYQALTEKPGPAVGLLASPYTVRFAIAKVLERLPLQGFVPRKNDARARAMHAHGDSVKTAGAFRRNLERIVELAAERGDPVILMSFAYYLAPGYSLEQFTARALDYGTHHGPVELWGKPDNVVRTIDVHNTVTRQVADRYETMFVDQLASIPGGGEYFDDLCHLAPAGTSTFVENVIVELRRAGVISP